MRRSSTKCQATLWQGLTNFFNNPEIDFVGDLLHTSICPKAERSWHHSLFSLSELKTCADCMSPNSKLDVFANI